MAEAKAIAYAAKKPLIGVHHIEGHIAANFIEHEDLEPPFFSLVVSGGHTHLVRVKDYGKFDIIGKPRDDAAGEAFDKVGTGGSDWATGRTEDWTKWQRREIRMPLRFRGRM